MLDSGHFNRMSKPQRRKGNAKTASSAQAAELLGAGGFIGFDIGHSNVFETIDQEFAELENEATIILKKLSKKDPQTREKALRELIDYTSKKEENQIQKTFTYYAAAFSKLSLDGSPTVRQLSLKTLSLFIGRLKKTAEKQLKKLIPFVLICSCDISTVVCAQADDLLKSCFPDGKSERVVQLFAEETADICCEFISQRHILFPSQKYDDEEAAAQREARLTTECLNLLSKLADVYPKASEIVHGLFTNTALLKKFLANNTAPQIQSGLINLAQRLPSSFNLAESPVSQFILNHLDSAEIAIGASSFNVLHLLISDHKEAFFAKFDVKKTLVPRLLTIVRKKLSHWRYCGPFLLPSFAAIYDQLLQDEASAFGLSLLVSFTDNMPFNLASISPSNWSTSFMECTKFFLTRVSGHNSITEKLTPIIVNTVDKADITPEEVQTDIVGLLKWICEKKSLPPTQLSSLFNNLELNLMNKRPQSDPLIAKLFGQGLDELATFHGDALRKKDPPTIFLLSLDKCGDEYFARISKAVDLLSLINDEKRQLSSPELKHLAVVALRVLNSTSDEEAVQFRGDVAIAVLKEQNNSWNALDLDILLRRLGLDVKDPAVFLTLMSVESSAKHVDIFVEILNSCEESVRAGIMQVALESIGKREIDFVLQSKESIAWSDDIQMAISKWLWLQYFDEENDDFEKIAAKVDDGTWTPEQELVRDFLPHLFSDMGTQFTGNGNGYLYNSDLLKRVLRLVRADSSILENLLVSSAFFDFVVESSDHNVAIRQMACSLPYVDVAVSPRSVSDSAALSFIEKLAPSVKIYGALVKSSISAEKATRTFALLQLIQAYLDLLGEYLEHGLHAVSKDIATIFAENPSSAAIALYTLTKEKYSESAIVHKALCNIRTAFPDAVSRLPNTLPLSMCWALKLDCSRLKLGITERFLTRFFCEDTPLEFISHLQAYCSQEGSTWQEDSRLFSAKAKDSMMWQLNVDILQAAGTVISESFESLTPEQLDFIMCGLIVAFETSDDIYSNDEPATIGAESLLGNALHLFLCCSSLCGKLEDPAKFTDWKDFYARFISRIVVRIWYKFPFSSESLTTLVSTQLATAVYRGLDQIPADLSLPTGNCARDSKFDKKTLALVDRCYKGLRSESYLDRFSSLRILLLLSTSLYRQENGVWVEDEEVSNKGPKRLSVASPLLSAIRDKEIRGFARFASMHAALEPLKSDSLADEEKLLYCESFIPLIDVVLPELIQACRDQRSDDEHPYMAMTDGPPVRYLENLVFEVFSLIPAVVRTWYNGLPRSASLIVNKFAVECVCQKIIADEFERVKDENKKLKKNSDFQIRVIPVSRQIVAKYTVDETQMVLTISMPENYPLGLPELDLEKAIVSNARSKKWLLQLTAYIFYQNGSIVAGIQQWKRNVDNDVDGAETCTICMMVVHQNSHQLPKVQCKQCRNKFHSNCLYKWFESSHNTACPLCRNNFT